MFIDNVKVTVAAGNGGNGVIAWRREKFIPKGGPAGGDGGNGGSIFLETDPQVLSLQSLRNRRFISARNGDPGGAATRKGKNGADLILKIPCGTLVKDALTGEVLFDLTEPSLSQLLCRGGKGGKGNNHFKSPTHQAPHICTEGTPGDTKEIELELKLIADVGLVGIPNAGKSSVMSKMTHLEVKIGAYPFTTLHPNLSYIQLPQQERILVADIPGIIEGAHLDKGLGLAFLKHIERTSLLLYVIDISGEEGRDPLGDFEILQNELREYNPDLLLKPTLIALNKIDVEGAQENSRRFREKFGIFPIFEISALHHVGFEALIEGIQEAVRLHPVE